MHGFQIHNFLHVVTICFDFDAFIFVVFPSLHFYRSQHASMQIGMVAGRSCEFRIVPADSIADLRFMHT